MPPPTHTVMWFRRDLRLHDNPALVEACAADGVLPLFVLDPALWDPAGAPRRAYLAASLRSLSGSLASLPGAGRAGLSVLRGDPAAQVLAAAREVGATRVHVAADFGPYGAAARRGGRGGPGPARDRAGPHRVAVRRGAGAGDQRLGRALQGLHAVLEGLGRARLAGPRRCPGRRAVARPRRDHRRSPTRRCPAGLALPEAGEAAARAALERVPRRAGRRLRRGPRQARRWTAPRACPCT